MKGKECKPRTSERRKRNVLQRVKRNTIKRKWGRTKDGAHSSPIAAKVPYVSRRTRVEVNSSAELSAACFQVSSQAQNHPDDSRYSSGRGLASISTRREYGLSPRQQRGGGDLHGATRGVRNSGKRRSHMVVEEELVWAPRQWSKKFDKFMVDRYLSIPVVGADEPPSALAAALGGL